MKRLQLIEIQDLPWCPAAIRDGVTDFLRFSTNRGGHYAALLPTLCYFIGRLEAPRVIDLCSGGSGPWQRLYPIIARTSGDAFRIILTDRYPNLAAFRQARELSGGIIDFREEPLDAGAVPPELTGFRTMFGSFHHFPPRQARQVLQNAVDCRQGIGIFEMTERHPVALLTMLTAPLFVLLLTPAIRPFRWSRLLLTYLLPVIPLVVLIDGLVSCLRTYSPAELAELTGSLAGAPYDWEIRKSRSPGSLFPVLYAIGCPRQEKPGGPGAASPTDKGTRC